MNVHGDLIVANPSNCGRKQELTEEN